MISRVIKATLCSIIGLGIVFGISAYCKQNATVMKFGIQMDVDHQFDDSYLFELKEDRILSVSKGQLIATTGDFYNTEKNGSIGFDVMEWYNEEDVLEEASVELSEKQYAQIIGICDDIQALGPQLNIRWGCTRIYLLYSGSVYTSVYISPEYDEDPGTPVEYMELCDRLIEFSPITVTRLPIEQD